MKGLLAGLCLVLGSVPSFAKTQDIKITTLNVRYYGLGGSMSGTPADEKRDPQLKKFFANYIPASDFYIFEEIVDVQRFTQNIVPEGFECISYEHPDPKHQHVVVCHSDKFNFEADPTDPDSLLEEIKVNERSRPAVHTLVTDKSGNVLFRIIGVHLKAYPQESKARQGQVTKIAAFLAAQNRGSIPTLIGGDSNTYKRDAARFTELLNKQGLNMYEAKNTAKYTYRAFKMRSKFDRFWLSPELEQIGKAQVFPLCNAKKSGKDFYNPVYYYNAVSDHCPVTITVRINN